MARRFEQLLGPARSGEVVAATTAKDYSVNPTSGIIAAATGDITVTLMDDSADIAISVVDGVFYPIRIKEVDATNATAFVALFNT